MSEQLSYVVQTTWYYFIVCVCYFLIRMSTNTLIEKATQRARELEAALTNPDIPSEERAAAKTVLDLLASLKSALRPGIIKIPRHAPLTSSALGVKHAIDKKKC